MAEPASSFTIREDDLRGPEIAALLQEHLEFVRRISPPESTHALDLERLRAPELTCWSVWDGDQLVGCGALQQWDARHGEIKSMCSATHHRRRGVGAVMLRHLLAVAEARGYRRLSLETGVQVAFAPARALYARHGFVPCGPFADYTADPNSVFMTRPVPAGPGRL